MPDLGSHPEPARDLGNTRQHLPPEPCAPPTVAPPKPKDAHRAVTPNVLNRDGEHPAANPSPRKRRSYQVQPFHEPDGRTTWAVKEVVVGPHSYFLRHLISFHETFTEAARQREKLRLREREGSWGESYEEAMLDAE